MTNSNKQLENMTYEKLYNWYLDNNTELSNEEIDQMVRDDLK